MADGQAPSTVLDSRNRAQRRRAAASLYRQTSIELHLWKTVLPGASPARPATLRRSARLTPAT